MALLRPAALVPLLRGAGSGGGFGRGRFRPGGSHTPWFSSAPRLGRCAAPPQPVVAAKRPFAVELKAGQKYAWCACGHSSKQPFCDGAHRKAAPGISPLRFTPEEDGRVWLCGCKRTRSPPYCDGTHKEEAVRGGRLSGQP